MLLEEAIETIAAEKIFSRADLENSYNDFKKIIEDMPLAYWCGLSYAALKSFGIPDISGVLADSELVSENQIPTRIKATMGVVEALIIRNYKEQEKLIVHMNRKHGKFPNIQNSQMIYLLSCMTIETVNWINGTEIRPPLGGRQLTNEEIKSNYIFWRLVGERMEIQNIPKTLEDMKIIIKAYEKENLKFDKNNRILHHSLLEVYIETITPRFLPYLLDSKINPHRGLKKLIQDNLYYLYRKTLKEDSWYAGEFNKVINTGAKLSLFSVIEPSVAAAFGYPILPKLLKNIFLREAKKIGINEYLKYQK